MTEEIKLEEVIPVVIKRKAGRPVGAKTGCKDPEKVRMSHNQAMKDYYKNNRAVMLERAKINAREKYKTDPDFRKQCNNRAQRFRDRQKEKIKNLEEKVKEFNDKLV